MAAAWWLVGGCLMAVAWWLVALVFFFIQVRISEKNFRKFIESLTKFKKWKFEMRST